MGNVLIIPLCHNHYLKCAKLLSQVPMFSGDIKTDVPKNVITASALCGSALTVISGAGLGLAAGVGLGVAYAAITPGITGDIVRTFGEVASNVTSAFTNIADEYGGSGKISAATRMPWHIR